MPDQKVKIYTTPSCPFCAMAKEYLRNKSVNYEEKNVAEDADARHDMVELSGQMGVPVISIDGEIIVGFNQTLLDSWLGKK